MSLGQIEQRIMMIQGASRGIGLELVKLLAPAAQQIYATCRRPDQAELLQELAQKWPDQIKVLRLDVTDEESIATAIGQVKEQRLHLLINTAGILHQFDVGMKPEKKIEDLRKEHMETAMRVNAIGPILLAKHAFPLLRHKEFSVLVNLSARVGSISDNRLGGWYSYRASKAAQNMMTKSISLELARRSENTIAVAYHPGTVDTDLSRPFQAGLAAGKLFASSQSAQYLINQVMNWDLNDNGKFFAWDGTEIPW